MEELKRKRSEKEVEGDYRGGVADVEEFKRDGGGEALEKEIEVKWKERRVHGGVRQSWSR